MRRRCGGQALATRGATDAFGQAAARAHRAAAAVAARENDPGSAEVARRELARRWLFDDDDGTDDLSGDDALSPSPLEKRDRALARAAVKVAFVLSARDGITLSGGDPIQAALQKALDGDAAADVVPRGNERGAVELLWNSRRRRGAPATRPTTRTLMKWTRPGWILMLTTRGPRCWLEERRRASGGG